MATRDTVDWSREEVEAIVADYLQMLTMELAGQAYNKTQHRQHLSVKLNARSESSIEFKHANISAVMIELGFPYIRGYQPRGNFQNLVIEVVLQQTTSYPLLDQAALAAVEQPAVPPPHVDFAHLKTEAPLRQEKASSPLPPSFRPCKRDYLEREAQNRSLGSAGEDFAVRFERWRLAANGCEALAEQVQHVSQTQGDGLGFDILSYNLDGSERFIEVKTTTFGRETPFFVSETELIRSKLEGENYRLYRLFEFRRQPRIFELAGALDSHCFLDPLTYRARFN